MLIHKDLFILVATARSKHQYQIPNANANDAVIRIIRPKNMLVEGGGGAIPNANAINGATKIIRHTGEKWERVMNLYQMPMPIMQL